MKSDDRYLTPPEIAETLGVTCEKVLNWIRSGKLRAVNISDGRELPRWKVSPEAWQKFLEDRSNVREAVQQ